jgi:hypothetical protein
VCILIGVSGCGSANFYPVKGKVIVYETGKYLTEGEVRFQPVSNSSLVATGKIKPNGTFSLETPGHGEGVLEGACRGAVLVPPRNGQPVVAERYRDFDTSELRYTVTARSENYFIIEVRRGDK